MAFVGDRSQIVPGPCDVTINSVQIGHSEENVEVVFGDAINRITSHEAGTVPVYHSKSPTPINIKIRALEIKQEVENLAFPEADTVSSTGLVTVTQDSFTELAGVTVRVHPQSMGTATTRDIVGYNMVPVGAPINQTLGREEKLMLNLDFERQWADSGTGWNLGD